MEQNPPPSNPTSAASLVSDEYYHFVFFWLSMRQMGSLWDSFLSPNCIVPNSVYSIVKCTNKRENVCLAGSWTRNMIDKAQISHMFVQPCKVLCKMSPSIHSYNMNISSFRHLLEKMY